MAQFTKIEVHFEDAQKVARMIVVKPNQDPTMRVQAIFLQGAESEFLDARKPNNVKPIKGDKPIKDVPVGILAGDVAAATSTRTSGPGDVCYLINGTLHCWLPD